MSALVIFSLMTLCTVSVIVSMEILTSEMFIMPKNASENHQRLMKIYVSLSASALMVFLLQFFPKIRRTINAAADINWRKVFVLLAVSVFNSLLFFFSKKHEIAFIALSISVPFLIIALALIVIANEEKYLNNTRLLTLIGIC